MSQLAPQPISTTVLHIGTSTVSARSAMDGQLGGWGAVVERCDDVYRGLARVLGEGRRRWRAVVVGVDGLRPAELELFALLRRHEPRLPVLVYGDAGSDDRLEEALTQGAWSEVDLAVIEQALVGEAELEDMEPADSELAEAAPESGLRPSDPWQVGVVPERGIPFDVARPLTLRSAEAAPEGDEPAFADDEVERAGEDEDDEDGADAEADEPVTPTVRFPWHGPADGPRRVPPRREALEEPEPDEPTHSPAVDQPASKTKPADAPPPKPATPDVDETSARPAAADEPAPAHQPGYTPLLTDEEWRALMGDDDELSSLSPRDPEEGGERA